MTTLAEIRERWAEVRAAERFIEGDPDAFWMQYAALHDLMDAIPADAVLVTPKALAAAIEDHFATGRHGWSYTSCATAVVMALTGVVGEESDVAHADAPSPLRAEGTPSEGARLG